MNSWQILYIVPNSPAFKRLLWQDCWGFGFFWRQLNVMSALLGSCLGQRLTFYGRWWYMKISLQLHCGNQRTYPCFTAFLFTITPHNILSKPLATFPHNHHWNNGQLWERNEFCHNDYHQSSKRLLAELRIKPATFCSPKCRMLLSELCWLVMKKG